jgi:hypothetical protein
MDAVTVPVPLVMLMEMALHGTVNDPPVDADTPEKPVAMYQVAVDAE